MSVDNLKIEIAYLIVDDLLPYARNPRKNDHAVEKGSSFIREFGFLVPVLIKKDMTVIDGHLRLKCAKKLKMKTVPTITIDHLTDVQIKALRLSINRFGELADWDDDYLKVELEELDNLQYDISSLDFPNIDITNQDGGTDGLTDPDEVPEVPQNVFGVKRGDVWILGNHRLMCGDSTSEIDVMQLMNGHKADMVFTDPPYGMFLDADYSSMEGWAKGKKYEKVKGDNEDFKPELITFPLSFFSYCKEIYLWGADYYAEHIKNKNDGSWLVWDKRVDESKEAMYGSSFELCWSKAKHKRNILRFMWAGFMGDKEARNRVHPTQKPSDMIVHIIDTYAKETKTVVDLFLGSGSTLIACEKTGRTCYGMELDEHYVSVIIKRFQDFTGKTAIKEV